MSGKTIGQCICGLAAICCAVSSILVSPGVVQAGGYAQEFQGHQSAGLAGAVTGRPDMPEAGYFNPAGWMLQDRYGVGGGVTVLVPLVAHEEPQSGERTRAEVDGAFPPYLHGFARFGDFAAGLSVGVPYGAGLQWPEDWSGRFEVTSTSLRAFEAAPSVAWRPVDWFALGAGPRIAWGQVNYERYLDFAHPGEEGFVRLAAGAPAMGGQVGAWAQVHDLWSVGLSWRSAMTLEFEGMARFEDIPPEMEHRAHDTVARTEMILPHRIAAGVAYELGVVGVISVDLQYTLWGAVENFEVHFESDGVDDIEEPRNWSNAIAMRVGAEYFAPVDGLSLRTGFAIDPSPVPEETLSPAQPDTDRTITSFGVGYEVSEFLQMGLAYNFIVLSQTASTGDGFPGVYDGWIHVFSLGVEGRPF